MTSSPSSPGPGSKLGPEARWLHQGMTSSDVLDTALAVQLKQAADLLIADLDELLAVLKRRALEHKLTPTIGRSHGIHAEPTSFGLKLAQAYAEFDRARARLVAARDDVATCAISGAVGTFANVSPEVEAHVAAELGLTPEPISTQVIPRDRHAMFFATLGVIASSIERLATEIRHLQRTEVLEAEEYFSPGQKGSSAMPHKRNPVLSENLTGLARMVRSAVTPGAGECRSVARARHLALVGRAVHRPRRDDHARFRARAAHRPDRQIARLSRADAQEPRPDGRPRPFAARAAGADPGRPQPRGLLRAGPAQRDEGVGIGRRAVAARAAQGTIPRSPAASPPAELEKLFDLDSSPARSRHDFRPGVRLGLTPQLLTFLGCAAQSCAMMSAGARHASRKTRRLLTNDARAGREAEHEPDELQIQPAGFLLQLSLDWIVLRASENVDDFLGESHVTLIEEPFGRFVQAQALHDLRNLFSRLSGSTGIARAYRVRLTDDRPRFDITFQVSDGRVLLEAVPSPERGLGKAIGSVGGLIEGLGGRSGPALLDGAARRMRALTGYDRCSIVCGERSAHSSRGAVPRHTANRSPTCRRSSPTRPTRRCRSSRAGRDDRSIARALLRSPSADALRQLRDQRNLARR